LAGVFSEVCNVPCSVLKKSCLPVYPAGRNIRFFWSLYSKTDVAEQYISERKGVSIGKRWIRFTNPGKIDYTPVQKMLAGTFGSTNTICG